MTRQLLPPGHAWYLYGIANRSEAENGLPPATVGVDGAALVTTIVCGELAAFVSVVPLVEFAAERVRALAGDDAWLGRVARQHERVVDALQRRVTIVPARLFCVYACEDDIRASLAQSQSSLTRVLQRLAGCDEFEVRLTFDRDLVRKDLVRSLPESKQLLQPQEASTPGRTYLMERRNAILMKSMIDDMIDGVGSQAFEELRSRAIADADLSPMRLADGNSMLTQRRAFLVSRAQRVEFLEAVEQVGLQRAQTRVACSGPWPPYNFVDVDPEVLQAQGGTHR